MKNLFAGLFRRNSRLSDAEDKQLDDLLRETTPRWSSSDNEGIDAFLERYEEAQIDFAQEASFEIFRSQSIVSVSREALVKMWRHFEEHRGILKRNHPLSARGPRMSGTQKRYRYDRDSILLLRRMGALFGRFLIEAVPTLKWGIGNSLVDEGYPVLLGFAGDLPSMNPTRVIVTIANRHMDDSNPSVLVEVFDRWVQQPQRNQEKLR